MASLPLRVLASGWGVAITVAVSASFAAPPAKTPAPDPAPALPAPQVGLKITPGSGGGPWSLKIENLGEGPVRIPADPRLLILELTPAALDTPVATKKKQAPLAAPRCVLPDDARPSSDDGHDLVVPSKRSWSVSFDPLFYCFGARERAALVAGTKVTARFGWPAPPPRPGAKPGKAPLLNPPLAVTPVGASVGKVSALKSIDADPIMLTEAVATLKSGEPSSSKETPDDTSNVWLTVPEAMDASRGAELATTVTLTNGTDRPITLFYRPDMLQFTVSGPAGTISCGAPRTVAAPIRELFITVPVKGSTSTSVLVTTTCPASTFDEAGVYRIVPRIDTTNASGRSIGMKTWDGVAPGKAPLLLRVRSPRKPGLLARPTLD
jgi:hypothetical protein